MRSASTSERERSVDARTHTIHQLHGNEPGAVVGVRVEEGADRQDGEANEEQRPSAPTVGLVADDECYRQHNHLRSGDARRHHSRREHRMLRGELLADERQKRRVRGGVDRWLVPQGGLERTESGYPWWRRQRSER